MCFRRNVQFLILSLASVWAFALTAANVVIDNVQQRFPWSNDVDITYTLSGIVDSHVYTLDFVVTVDGVTKTINIANPPHLVPGSDWRFSNGTYTVQWNAAAAGNFPEKFDNASNIELILVDEGGSSAPPDAIGLSTGINADMVTVDISDGPNASTYVVEYWNNVDVGLFNCDTYKTKKIALRKIPAGTYRIGCGTESASNVGPVNVTATNDFYIGIFPVTEKQYLNVVGGTLSYNDGDNYPVRGLSYLIVRGSASHTVAPTSGNSFMYKLISRCQKIDGTPVKLWDLPTEAQWEIMARGGVTTAWLCGSSSTTLGKYAYYSLNPAGGTCGEVGALDPNDYGIYHVEGGVWEMCLDSCNGSQKFSTFKTYVDEPSPRAISTARMYRGGAVNLPAAQCALSFRYGTINNSATGEYQGFRLKLREKK